MKKALALLLSLMLVIPFAAMSVTAAEEATAPAPVEYSTDGVISGNIVADTIVGTGNFDNEGPENLFDGDTATKLCTNVLPATVTWQMDAAYKITGYYIATANDNAEYNGRLPATWTLYGSNDGFVWEPVDTGSESELAEVNFSYFKFDAAPSNAYKFFKLSMPSCTSGTLQISELALIGEPADAAGVNYALGAAVEYSSTETADFPGELAVDGDMATRWASATTDTEYLIVDLGSVKSVGYVYVAWEFAAAADYTIDVSTDKENWTTVGTVTDGPTGDTKVFKFDAVDAQYVRVNCTRRASEWGNSIYEIIVRSAEWYPMPAASTLTSSTGSFDNEGAVNLVDNDTATKFCTNVLPATAVFDYGTAIVPTAYIIASANDNAEYNGRLPATWTVSGSNDGFVWTEIDAGTEAELDEINFTVFTFPVSAAAGYRYYKLDIPSCTSGTMQISEFGIVGAPGTAAATEYTYPLSGGSDAGELIGMEVIGNEEGWGGNAEAGRAAAFDGNPGTFFDPLGVADGFIGVDGGAKYILTEVKVLPRDGWTSRYLGAMIQGSNDGESWTTLYTSDAEAATRDWQIITEFSDNTGYKFFRYFNETSHGDVAEVEFYGTPSYVYPASGEEGALITGAVIGNEAGWGDNAAAGRDAGFDGNPNTFFDPLGVGDGYLGIDAGAPYTLDKVAILSRSGQLPRYVGAMIQGSNDGENWTTLYTSDVEGADGAYNIVTEFENNTGYSMYRYFNETNHGDVAEVEFYGTPAEAPAEVEETPAEVVVVDTPAPVVTKAPQTFDAAVIFVLAAAISAAGVMIGKKH